MLHRLHPGLSSLTGQEKNIGRKEGKLCAFQFYQILLPVKWKSAYAAHSNENCICGAFRRYYIIREIESDMTAVRGISGRKHNIYSLRILIDYSINLILIKSN